MGNDYLMLDGKKIGLSKETSKNLKEQLTDKPKFESNCVIGFSIKLKDDVNDCWPIRFGGRYDGKKLIDRVETGDGYSAPLNSNEARDIAQNLINAADYVDRKRGE
jgi:hypothetical protein